MARVCARVKTEAGPASKHAADGELEACGGGGRVMSTGTRFTTAVHSVLECLLFLGKST